ncbi:MAG: hypothetical protein H6754_03505 [Candidatus Omnitrophica bacterium]|nr:hypothetical protein [Candidatus Omnitrophota bacterium]
MAKTKLGQKLGLVVLGVLLALVLLEIGLRVGERLYLSIQDHQNRSSQNILKTKPGRVYRILCLGESTTAFGGENSYPRQLAKILNEKNVGQFIVINKGLPATTTDKIVEKLDNYLKEYKPDIVTAMIGVNDLKTTPVFVDGKARYFGLRFKVVKLFQMLTQHLQARREEIKNSEKEQALYRAVALSPDNYRARLQLAEYYVEIESYDKAQEQFKKVLSLASVPSVFKLGALFALAECYVSAKKYDQAEGIYQHLLQNFTSANNKEKVLFYNLLIELYLEAQKPRQAIATFAQRNVLDPTGVAMYMKIAYAYRELKRFDELENILRQGLAAHSSNTKHYVFLYSELGYCLLENKKYKQAHDVFQKILSLNSQEQDDFRVDVNYGLELAAKGLGGQTIKDAMIPVHREEYYLPATIANYNQLKDTVLKRGIKLIAIQYPMRPLKPLQEILNFDSRIVFVDNEMLFKNKVAASEYSQYFVDHFGGDFGHCTAQGNALLAGNLASAIWGVSFK